MKTLSYIFICGISRTGSKFYSQFLNSHKDIYICPELLIKHPFKKSFTDLVQKKLASRPSMRELSDFIIGLDLKDTYTAVVSGIDPELMSKKLNSLRVVTPMEVFRAIIELAAGENVVSGAKFPVHYRYSYELLEHFPRSKILFLTRDPRDIYCSDVHNKRKRLKNNQSMSALWVLLRPFVFCYTLFEWANSLKSYSQIAIRFGESRVRLFRYEDIESGLAAKNISEFIGCHASEFNEDNIKRIDSSFNMDDADKNWDDRLSRIEKLMFRLCIGGRMRELSYY